MEPLIRKRRRIPKIQIKIVIARYRMQDVYMHKVLTYIEYRAVSGVFRTNDPPPPLHPASVSSPRKGGGLYIRRAVRGWGSIFRKTPDIGLASNSIIPLRIYICDRKKVWKPAWLVYGNSAVLAGAGAWGPPGLCKAAYDARALASCMIQVLYTLGVPQREDSHR
jgi:hypothetical protein